MIAKRAVLLALMVESRFEFTAHALEMLQERGIREEWVRSALSNPEHSVTGVDNTTHFYKTIDECGGKVLHVVVNAQVVPQRIVTVFFDRNARRRE